MDTQSSLLFDWDSENLSHIARHDVSQQEAEFVLTHPTLDLGLQDWHEEDRFEEVGATAGGRVLVVITTWREDRIRVVTAYDAPRLQKEAYHASRQ